MSTLRISGKIFQTIKGIKLNTLDFDIDNQFYTFAGTQDSEYKIQNFHFLKRFYLTNC